MNSNTTVVNVVFVVVLIFVRGYRAEVECVFFASMHFLTNMTANMLCLHVKQRWKLSKFFIKHKCFIITNITKITWVIKRVLSVNGKSTKAKEHTTVDA